MSKSGASAPSTIDPTALANAQSTANQQSAQTQSIINNVNTNSPLGFSRFSLTPSGQWDLTQQLDPAVQSAFANQSSLAGTLANLANTTATWAANPAWGGANVVDTAFNQLSPQIPTGAVDTTNLSPIQTTLPTNFGKQVTDAQNAAYDTQTGYLDPQFKEKQSDLDQQLADQGISAGTQAYDRAQGDLGRQETLAYQQAKDAAVAAGNQEQGVLYGEGATSGNFANAAQQQGFNQDVTKWGEPLAALGSAVNTGEQALGGATSDLTGLSPLSNFTWAGAIPTFGNQGTVVPSTDVVRAGQVGVNSAANAFNAGNTLNNSLFNGIGSVGGALGLGNGGLGSMLGLGSLFGGGSSGLTTGATAAGLTDFALGPQDFVGFIP